jgi:hypothetical protein
MTIPIVDYLRGRSVQAVHMVSFIVNIEARSQIETRAQNIERADSWMGKLKATMVLI